ncbi:MAG: hypothetical protein ACM3JH_04440, partial [Acidithiobacillales bacterium]
MSSSGRRKGPGAASLLLCVALAGPEALADLGACRVLPEFGISPPPASLSWKPFLARKRTVAPGGLLGPAIETLTAAFHAIESVRRDPARRPEAFLVRPFLNGFIVYAYPFPEGSGFSLGEVSVTDFPFGGTAEEPEAWLVDAKGRTGALLRDERNYRLVRLGRDGSGKLVPEDRAAKSFRLGRDS